MEGFPVERGERGKIQKQAELLAEASGNNRGKGGSGKEERRWIYAHTFLSLSYFYTTLYNI